MVLLGTDQTCARRARADDAVGPRPSHVQSAGHALVLSQQGKRHWSANDVVGGRVVLHARG